MRRPRWRRYFFTGLVVLFPLGVTVLVLSWLFRTLDAIFGGPIERLIGTPIPGLGLVLLLLTVLAIGWLAHYAIGRRLISWGNALLARFPLTSRIYNATSQIVQTFMGDQQRVFQRTVLIEFPTAGSYALAWVTAEENRFAEAMLGEPCVNVFVATTPNPTSGYFLIVPRSRTRPLDLTIDEAMQLVISAGAVMPNAGAPPRPRGLDLAALLRQSPGSPPPP